MDKIVFNLKPRKTINVKVDGYSPVSVLGKVNQAVEHVDDVKAQIDAKLENFSENKEQWESDLNAKLNSPEVAGTDGQVLTSDGIGGSKWEDIPDSYDLPQATNGIPAGGTAGQILSKIDGTDYNAEWVKQKRSFHFFLGGAVAQETSAISTFATMPIRLLKVFLGVDAAPTGQPIVCDVNLNGASIFPDTNQQPVILAGETQASCQLPTPVNVQEFDKISVDIDQAGNQEPGSNLSVVILCEVV